MKAPSVRGGSKENGTQVTGNRIYKGCLVCKKTLPDLALIPRTIANTPGSGSGDGIMLIKLLPSPTLNGDRPAFSNKLDSGHNKIILLRGKDHDPRGSSAAN
jgi:hypothetical protein